MVSSFPVVGSSQIMIPVGVYVQGVVDRVVRPGRVKGRAQLDLHFTTMIFPNGQVIEVPGVLNSLPGSDGAKVKGNEGTVEQAGNKGRDVGNVLKGAAIGAEGGVIGGAATGNVAKGVGYGSLAGAAAGAIYTLFTRGNDIVIPSGTAVEMVLQRPLILQQSQLAGLDETHGPASDGSRQPAATNAEAEAANSVSVWKPGLQRMSSEAQEPGPVQLPGRSFWLWGRDMLFSLAVSFFIITFLYQPVRVEGTSMLPRLGDQDRLFINKFVYHFESVHRGDVVVFHYPRDPQKSYIKRVIAEPGDELRIDDGRTYINGRLLPEPYVPRKYHDSRSQDAMVIPSGEYFVMGDHRSISSDSRDFGPVPRDLIYGKAAFVYWPAEDMGIIH